MEFGQAFGGLVCVAFGIIFMRYGAAFARFDFKYYTALFPNFSEGWEFSMRWGFRLGGAVFTIGGILVLLQR